MKITELFERQLKSFRQFFPNIVINESDVKKRFLRRYSKFPGVNKTLIYVLPEILDTDVRWLKLVNEMKKFITRPTKVIGSVYLDDPLREKDANRLNCVPSASMVPTIGNPDYLLRTKYSDSYNNLFLECLDLIRKEVNVPNVNTVVRKRKNSSSGSFISSMDTKTFASMFANFENMLFKIGHIGLKEKFENMADVYTIPITRRMIKTPKVIKDYSIKGEKVVIDRHLDYETMEAIKQSEKQLLIKINKEELVGPKHRMANNVSEIERMTHFYYQMIVDTERYIFPLSMKYDEEYIKNLLNEVNKHNKMILSSLNKKNLSKEEFLNLDEIYNFFCSDGTAFDKHIPEHHMVALENYYSAFYEDCPINFNYEGFLAKFRKHKQIVISKDDQNVSLFEELIKRQSGYNSKYSPIKGLDSGKTSVQADGKKNRLITEVAMATEVLGHLSNKEKLGIISGYLELPGRRIGLNHKFKIYNINSSDDHFMCSVNKYIKKIRKVVELNNDAIEKKFLPIEEDPEFLSNIIYLNDNLEFEYKPNLSRRITSLLKPEHSMVTDLDNLVMKDIKYSYTDKLNTIQSFGKLGIEIANKFLQLFNDIFHQNFWSYIDKCYNKYSVNIGDLELHKYADLNDDEKQLLYDLDRYFYKIDQSKIRNEILTHLFWNINRERLTTICEKLHYKYIDIPDDKIHSHVMNLRKEALKWE